MSKAAFLLNRNGDNFSASFIDLNIRFSYMWFLIVNRVSKCHVRLTEKPSPCSWGISESEGNSIRWSAQQSKPVLLKLECARASPGILPNCRFWFGSFGVGPTRYPGEAPRRCPSCRLGPLLEKAGSRQIFLKEICTNTAWPALPSFQRIKQHWDNNTQTTCFANGTEENEPI